MKGLLGFLGALATLISVMVAILSPTWSRMASLEADVKDIAGTRDRFVIMETTVKGLQGTEGLPQQFDGVAKQLASLVAEVDRLEKEMDAQDENLDTVLQREMRLLNDTRDEKLRALDEKIQMEILHVREMLEQRIALGGG